MRSESSFWSSRGTPQAQTLTLYFTGPFKYLLVGKVLSFRTNIIVLRLTKKGGGGIQPGISKLPRLPVVNSAKLQRGVWAQLQLSRKKLQKCKESKSELADSLLKLVLRGNFSAVGRGRKSLPMQRCFVYLGQGFVKDCWPVPREGPSHPLICWLHHGFLKMWGIFDHINYWGWRKWVLQAREKDFLKLPVCLVAHGTEQSSFHSQLFQG